MGKIVANNIEYDILRNERNAFEKDEFLSKCTDYFNDFDYILGDYSYEKLRLKGFYDEGNKKVGAINNIKDVDTYIKNYCSYGAKYYLLKKNARKG